MDEIFTYTEQKAPYLLGRVKELVIQFIRYSKSAHELIPKLEKQIELESSGNLIFELDNRPIKIPQGFRDAYPKIFSDVYRRAYLNLTDKNKAPQALVEIFVEFLTHDEEFKELGEHHKLVLNDIADMVCARLNGQSPEEFVAVKDAHAAVPDAKRLRLDEDILNSVEQELLKLEQINASGPLK